MLLDEYIESISPCLAALGLHLTDRSSGGPMGGALWRFSSTNVQLEIMSDRGKPLVGVAPGTGTAFGVKSWDALLGIAVRDEMSFGEQVEYFLESFEEIKNAVERYPDIEERLLDLNWDFVKARLGLDPAKPRPGRKPAGPGGHSDPGSESGD